jgi:predicted secreted protein|tara:strand:+ start:3701 stop:4324 length:624 start_codon:yes stop_codon:yes gene_type:complete
LVSHRAKSAARAALSSGKTAPTNARTFSLVSSRRTIAVYVIHRARAHRQSSLGRFFRVRLASSPRLASRVAVSHLSQRSRDESRLALRLYRFLHVAHASRELCPSNASSVRRHRARSIEKRSTTTRRASRSISTTRRRVACTVDDAYPVRDVRATRVRVARFDVFFGRRVGVDVHARRGHRDRRERATVCADAARRAARRASDDGGR